MRCFLKRKLTAAILFFFAVSVR